MRAALLIVAPAILSIGFSQAPRPDLSEKALVARASAYVSDYEKRFAFLVADEEYKQTMYVGRRQIETRLLKSELFTTYLLADDEWIVVRDVVEVDGVALKERPDMRALLSKKDELRGIAAQIAERNARYNIGNVTRNFNEPTLPLLLLKPKRLPYLKFDRKQVAAAEDGATIAILEFEERKDHPTLIHHGLSMSRVPAKGEIAVDTVTGATRRTVFTIKIPGTSVRLETTYTRDTRLDMWLPAAFVERYESTWSNGLSFRDDRQVIECEAKYTNYRRFETTGRIK